MDIPACIAEASSTYQIAESVIASMIKNGLPSGIIKNSRVGLTGIPQAWLPIFERMGMSAQAITDDACQNIIAGAWVMAFQTQQERGIKQHLKAPRLLSKLAQQRRQKWSYAVQKASMQTGEPAELINAVIRAESVYNDQAVSKAKAIGLMQLMPDTASMLGVNPWDGEQNILGGAKYLAQLRKQFSGNLHLMLAAYNAGPNAVKRYGYQIPPYAETQAYVPKVLTYLYSEIN